MSKQCQIISVNGQYINRNDFSIPLTNRAFRFGDGLFETMHANGLEVQFLEDHFNRLLKGAKVLHLDLPIEFTVDYLKKHINGLLNRCKLYQGAKVRLMVYRSGAGLFIPEKNNVEIIIEADYLNKGSYELNTNGLVIDVFSDLDFAKSPVSGFKSMNSFQYILGGIYAKENNLDDVLLINSKGIIVEATSSNLFCFKDKQLFTPDVCLGGVIGIMRKKIIHVAKQKGYNVNENAFLTLDDLLEMDEVFLTNAVVGIKWVTGIKQRRYYKRYSVKLLRELNQQLFT